MTYSHPLQLRLFSSVLESLQAINQTAAPDSDEMGFESDAAADAGGWESEELVVTANRRSRRYYVDARRARPAWECRRNRSRWAR